MRGNNRVELIRRESALPNATADLYDFGAKQTESSRLRRIKALEHENASLMRVLSETGVEVGRLRALLTGL